MRMHIVLAQGINTIFRDQLPTFNIYLTKQFPIYFMVCEAVEVFK